MLFIYYFVLNKMCSSLPCYYFLTKKAMTVFVILRVTAIRVKFQCEQKVHVYL